MANYTEQGTAIDTLPKHFRGIVVLGLPSGKVYMGLKGLYEDRQIIKECLPTAKWEPVAHTKSWLVEMTNANQKEIWKGLVEARKLGFEDVAIEGCKPQMRQSIVGGFQKLGLIA